MLKERNRKKCGMHCPLREIDLIVVELHGNILNAVQLTEIQDRLLSGGFVRDGNNSLGHVAVFAKPSRGRHPAAPSVDN